MQMPRLRVIRVGLSLSTADGPPVPLHVIGLLYTLVCSFVCLRVYLSVCELLILPTVRVYMPILSVERVAVRRRNLAYVCPMFHASLCVCAYMPSLSRSKELTTRREFGT